MVLTAANASLYTAATITTQEAAKLQTEVDLTERTIINAANLQKYAVQYNATTVGNPYDDPLVDTNLTALQIAYRDAFVAVGYNVSIDATSGYWSFTWASQGIESNVAVYSTRTTVSPSAISASTITEINSYFSGLILSAYAASTSVQSGTGGDIQETDFGGTNSVFYEYITVVRQQDNLTDLSSGLLTQLSTGPVGVGLGYTSTNMAVYKLV
jgi:hypothetical protein